VPQMTEPMGRECVLGLDVGEKRVGVALSDPLRLFARPLCVLNRASRAEDFRAIARLICESQVGLVVCGYPIFLDGTEGAQGRRIRRYAEALETSLAAECPTPVRLWDESYSTREAAVAMAASGRHRTFRERRNWIDAVAAAVILQSYLDERRPAASQEDNTP